MRKYGMPNFEYVICGISDAELTADLDDDVRV